VLGESRLAFLGGFWEGGEGGEWCAAGAGFEVVAGGVVRCVVVVVTLHTLLVGDFGGSSTSISSSKDENGLEGFEGREGGSFSFFLSIFFLYIKEGLLK
jgi:hypothetical protein